MSDIGADVFAEWGVVPENVPLSVFRLLVRSVECTGTRISRVLFGMEERLGRRMLCRMKGMTVFC